MGKHFSKRVQEKKPSKATENLPESKSENKSNNNKQPEQKTLDRKFDDTPIPEPYNAPRDSPFLPIPEVKPDLGSIDGIPIWNPSDMFWQEKFDDLGLLDDDYVKDIDEIKKLKIKDMTKKQCCEFVTYYMRNGIFTKGVANSDIPRLAKRINDLYQEEKGK